MAAAAQGRDFLVSKDSGHMLIDTFMTVVGVSSGGKNVKMRNLILMALYNVRYGTVNKQSNMYFNFVNLEFVN